MNTITNEYIRLVEAERNHFWIDYDVTEINWNAQATRLRSDNGHGEGGFRVRLVSRYHLGSSDDEIERPRHEHLRHRRLESRRPPSL